MADRTEFGPWLKEQLLGKGGQGEVFVARRASNDSERLVTGLGEALTQTHSTRNQTVYMEQLRSIVSIIRAIANERSDPVGALKILHSIADRAAAAKAKGRMEQEVAALGAVQHPALVRLHEFSIDERWLVMEYFQRGDLFGHLGRTQGDVLGSLLALRPLVKRFQSFTRRAMCIGISSLTTSSSRMTAIWFWATLD